MTTPRCTALILLLAVAGGGWCQTQLLDPEPRTCRTQDNAADASALSQGRRNEYPAGGVLMVLAEVPAGLFGFLEIDLCPEGGAEVECLDRVPLQLADGSGTKYNLQKVPRTNKYEIPVILPDDITCETCTLQMRVLTRQCADEDACPQTEDTFCSDITVRKIKKIVRKKFSLSKRFGRKKEGSRSSKLKKYGARFGKFLKGQVKSTMRSTKGKLKSAMRSTKGQLKSAMRSTKGKLKSAMRSTIDRALNPYQSMPDQDIPDQEIPDQNIPDQDIPDQNILDQDIPDQNIPDQDIPDQNIPDQDMPY